MSNFLDNTKFNDRSQRDKMLRLSQSYSTGKNKVLAQQHFRDVLRVNACETKDHAVNYDAQLKK
jgi:hypothetical protein